MTLGELDRGITNAIRKKLVLAGYLPDKLIYNTPATYKAAKDAIVSGGKQVIEFSGPGNAENRGELVMHKIIISRGDQREGSIGGWPEFYYEPNPADPTNKYDKYLLPDKTENVEYEVRYVTDLVEYDEIINHIISQALGQRKYLPGCSSTGVDISEVALFERRTVVDLSNKNFIEKLYRFEAIDVWLQDPELVDTVGKMKTIDAQINPAELDNPDMNFTP